MNKCEFLFSISGQEMENRISVSISENIMMDTWIILSYVGYK